MLLLFGASLSAVNKATFPAIAFNASTIPVLSTGLTTMPATPSATSCSNRRAWAAAVDWSGYLKTSVNSGNSLCAFLTPASAGLQKSDTPLATKANVFLSADCATPAKPINIAAATAIKRFRTIDLLLHQIRQGNRSKDAVPATEAS